MVTFSKTDKIAISVLSLTGVALFYIGATDASTAILLLSLVLYIVGGRSRTKKVSDAELISFLRSFALDYRKTKSIQLALKEALKHGFSFNVRLQKMLTQNRLGGTYGREHNDNLDKLAGILCSSYRRGTDASKALELFARYEEKEDERKNKEAKLSSGMEMITQAGMSFFFPMFGGISVGILDFISKVPASVAQGRFSMIIIGYILIVSFLYSSFYKSERSALDAIYSSIPYFSIGITVFALSVLLIHEVI